MKPVSRFARPASLDSIMSGGWRALETESISGWVCRFSHGVTRRANSVLPLAGPVDVAGAIDDVEAAYRSRGLPPVFQISPDSLPCDLDAILAARGYALDSPTLVQLLARDDFAQAAANDPDPRVAFEDSASVEWLAAFWESEGPHSPAAQAISERILGNTPSVYASLTIDGHIHAVARMALVGDLGGIYAVATREESRSRGHGRAVMRALVAEAGRRDLAALWLQVVEANATAAALYSSLGFETVSRYHYRQLPA
ncbi:GNAT family N-acetyltransferase [Paeniglutamicibacter sp.]|uniref:GNAT family N-acetyltransferase n=1 Tax=Paeniglutamicibacter sp. TaxID=1934391 RepID=UPI00398A2BA8